MDQNFSGAGHRVSLTPPTTSLPQAFTKCMGMVSTGLSVAEDLRKIPLRSIETGLVQGRGLLIAEGKTRRTEENSSEPL